MIVLLKLEQRDKRTDKRTDSTIRFTAPRRADARL